MRTVDDLRNILARIDGRGYKAYKDLQGAYAYPGFTLFIDHVQGDPFASPSKIRVRVPGAVAKLPPDLFSGRVRRVALQDFLIREVYHAIHHVCQGNRGIGKSGLIVIDVGGQEVLERTAMVVTPQWVEARLSLGLPAQGRTIMGRQAEAMFCQEMPEIAERALKWEHVDQERARAFVDCADNQESIRTQLDALGLVAFIADGAILPRSSGASDRPLSRQQAQSFRAPDSLRVSIPILHPVTQDGRLTHSLTGFGIPKGVTLIVGGGVSRQVHGPAGVGAWGIPSRSGRRPGVRGDNGTGRQNPCRRWTPYRTGRHQRVYQKSSIRTGYRTIFNGQCQREHQSSRLDSRSPRSRGHHAVIGRGYVRDEFHGEGCPHAGVGSQRARTHHAVRGSCS